MGKKPEIFKPNMSFIDNNEKAYVSFLKDDTVPISMDENDSDDVISFLEKLSIGFTSTVGELICNYIPAKYNGNVGVYDLVNKELLFDTGILEGNVAEDPVHITTLGTPNTISFNSQTA